MLVRLNREYLSDKLEYILKRKNIEYELDIHEYLSETFYWFRIEYKPKLSEIRWMRIGLKDEYIELQWVNDYFSKPMYELYME